ncbi:MAG: hypothetical protein N2689_18565, partial [Verrucomicrobiae bacterium]|nr:hypothetical protein [Verrucomicrobiae bacterium]
RILCAPDNPVPLIEPALARALLDSARFYHERQQWHARLFLLMPDHLHALLVFPMEARMGEVIRNWKRFHARRHDVRWQENFFDHRLRSEDEQTERYHYILNNPVAKGLCQRPEQWPWVIRDADLLREE